MLLPQGILRVHFVTKTGAMVPGGDLVGNPAHIFVDQDDPFWKDSVGVDLWDSQGKHVDGVSYQPNTPHCVILVRVGDSLQVPLQKSA